MQKNNSKSAPRRWSWGTFFLTIPYVIWMAVFILIPLGVVMFYALTDPATGLFSLNNLSKIFTGAFPRIFLRSVWYSLVASLICLVIGYPVAYFIARQRPGVQRFLYLLVMLPMCMSFLLRTLAWVGLLRDTGIINQFLGLFGIGPLPLIRTTGAVILGMVYNYLPYMILPLYTVIMKIDPLLIEAAEDLGCSSRHVFARVILPLSMPGIISGITMVFVPAVSTFAISHLLGGGKHLLLGNLIEMQFKGSAYNPYLGSAVALVMMVIVVICMSVMNRFGEGEEQAVML